MKKQTEKYISVYNSNMYIQLRHSFSIIQKRVIHFVVKQLQDEIYNLNDQKYKGKPIERTLFGDCYFHIPTKTIDPLNQDTEIRKALKGLMVPLENSTTIGHFLMKATRLDGEWRLLFNEESVHFLTEVSKGVTPLQTLVYLSAKSIYTIRMYEILMQYRDTGKFYTTPENIAELLGVPENYKKNFALLNQKALTPAKTELKELFEKKQSDIFFEWHEVRGGRGNKVQKLDFSIYWKDKAVAKDTEQSQNLRYIAEQLNRIMIENAPKRTHKANKDFINRAMSKLTENGKTKLFAERLEKLLQDPNVVFKDKGGVVRWMLQNDFLVE